METLDATGKQRCKEKLESIGLSIGRPENNSRFSADLSSLPQIDTFGYFVSHPGTYTEEQLFAWKQLEA